MADQTIPEGASYGQPRDTDTSYPSAASVAPEAKLPKGANYGQARSTDPSASEAPLPAGANYGQRRSTDSSNGSGSGNSDSAASIPEKYGFTPGHLASAAWEGVGNIASSLYGAGRDLISEKTPVFLSDKPEDQGSIAKRMQGDTLFNKYVLAPAAAEQTKAQNAKTPLESIGHSVAEALPVIGPIAAHIGERAGTGDIGGALAEGATYAAAPKVTEEVAGGLPKIVRGVMDRVRANPVVDALIPSPTVEPTPEAFKQHWFSKNVPATNPAFESVSKYDGPERRAPIDESYNRPERRVSSKVKPSATVKTFTPNALGRAVGGAAGALGKVGSAVGDAVLPAADFAAKRLKPTAFGGETIPLDENGKVIGKDYLSYSAPKAEVDRPITSADVRSSPGTSMGEPEEAAKYTSEERRATARSKPLSAAELEEAIKLRTKVATPFDDTEGAMATVNRDPAMPKVTGATEPEVSEEGWGGPTNLREMKEEALRHALGDQVVDKLSSSTEGAAALKQLGNGTHRNYADLANYEGVVKPKALSAKTGAEWTPEDFKRTVAEHGKELNPTKELVARHLADKYGPADIMGRTEGWGKVTKPPSTSSPMNQELHDIRERLGLSDVNRDEFGNPTVSGGSQGAVADLIPERVQVPDFKVELTPREVAEAKRLGQTPVEFDMARRGMSPERYRAEVQGLRGSNKTVGKPLTGEDRTTPINYPIEPKWNDPVAVKARAEANAAEPLIAPRRTSGYGGNTELAGNERGTNVTASRAYGSPGQSSSLPYLDTGRDYPLSPPRIAIAHDPYPAGSSRLGRVLTGGKDSPTGEPASETYRNAPNLSGGQGHDLIPNPNRIMDIIPERPGKVPNVGSMPESVTKGRRPATAGQLEPMELPGRQAGAKSTQLIPEAGGPATVKDLKTGEYVPYAKGFPKVEAPTSYGAAPEHKYGTTYDYRAGEARDAGEKADYDKRSLEKKAKDEEKYNEDFVNRMEAVNESAKKAREDLVEKSKASATDKGAPERLKAAKQEVKDAEDALRIAKAPGDRAPRPLEVTKAEARLRLAKAKVDAVLKEKHGPAWRLPSLTK